MKVQGLISDVGWLSSASVPAARVDWDDIGGLRAYFRHLPAVCTCGTCALGTC